VLALTLGQAKTIAVLVVLVLLALAFAAAWLMKTVAQKAALAVILGLLALLVWTQRTSLEECADKVREGGVQVDATCDFFGRQVRVSTNRSS
jgi:protein-S-isoprenylcysteine O-methyltransferase Ste14